MLLGYENAAVGNNLSGSRFPRSPGYEPYEDERPSGERLKYRTIWISDIHLGTKGCNAAMLIDFLDSTDSEMMYLVGDIIDGWRLKKRPCEGGATNAPSSNWPQSQSGSASGRPRSAIVAITKNDGGVVGL